eukprot:TRINITY_DN8100_c0_g4_i1.p1 TRINITY_DN8100_c0_g4~~TRINITY_DN8100_c0_g4_i1.p1  ORF type:complete len:366 (+),score=149.43 TRINITY_DN8100_c0_g4_i1:57-1154(+)
MSTRRTPPPGGARSASSPPPPPAMFDEESASEDEAEVKRKAKAEPAIPQTDTYRPLGAGSDRDKFKGDMDRLPDGLTNDSMVGMDSEAIAVRLLRGMTRRDGSAWKEGEALQTGGTVEALIAVPRRQGAGLGSDESQVVVAPGEKPRNYVAASEKLVKKKSVAPGEKVFITDGAHEGLFGIVLAFPAGYDFAGPPQLDAKIKVELEASHAEVTIKRAWLRLPSKDDLSRSRKRAASPPPEARKRRREARKLEWVCRTGLLVRCTDTRLDGGRQYNAKLRVYDITSATDFCLEAAGGRVIEGVTEDMVETVIPRDEGAKVAIVRGSKKGHSATLVSRDKKRQEVQVRFEGSLTKKFTYSYYDICAL